jgi:hypothetical protein
MRALTILEGRVSSGHFIYVRDAGSLMDQDLLVALGLHGYTPDLEPVFPCHVAHITRAGDWVCYVDDWFYTAYNSTGIGAAVSALGKRYEVFRAAIGDADYSLELYHFVNGSPRRRFHFRDFAGKSSVILDRGTPFRCESSFRLGADPWPYVCSVVDEIGIDSRGMTSSISTYSKPYKQR